MASIVPYLRQVATRQDAPSRTSLAGPSDILSCPLTPEVLLTSFAFHLGAFAGSIENIPQASVVEMPRLQAGSRPTLLLQLRF